VAASPSNTLANRGAHDGAAVTTSVPSATVCTFIEAIGVRAPIGRGGVEERRHLDARFTRHHDAFVRTTLTLDADVAALLEQEAHRLRQPFKQVVNDALRRGLTRRPQRKKRFHVDVHHARLQAGVDPGHLNRLADELEDEAVVGKTGR
jgi:hypothetical protein